MDAWAQKVLAARPEVEEIIVFGSFADRTFVPGSDLDVFLVLTASPHSIRDRIPIYLPDAFPVPMDVFPFTREEIEARRPSALWQAVKRSTWRYDRRDCMPEER